MAIMSGCGPMGEPQPALGTSDGQPLVVSVASTPEVRIGGAPVTDAIRIQSNSADPAYRTTWTLGTTTCLRVVPRTGEPVIIEGQPMVADYYHVGRVLGVAIGPAGSQQLLGFADPVSWQTTPCPAPAAPATPATP